MKLLRNPWVVAVLAIVMLVVLAMQFFHPHGARGPAHPVVNPPPAAAASAPAAAPASAADNQASQVPVLSVDRTYAESHLAGWMSAPKRDPFFQVKPVPVTTVHVNLLTLKAIWRQDGVSMVAINHAVCHLGDHIAGYTVATIEDNDVWLEANGQRELLTFVGSVMVTPPVNIPAAPN